MVPYAALVLTVYHLVILLPELRPVTFIIERSIWVPVVHEGDNLHGAPGNVDRKRVLLTKLILEEVSKHLCTIRPQCVRTVNPKLEALAHGGNYSRTCNDLLPSLVLANKKP